MVPNNQKVDLVVFYRRKKDLAMAEKKIFPYFDGKNVQRVRIHVTRYVTLKEDEKALCQQVENAGAVTFVRCRQICWKVEHFCEEKKIQIFNYDPINFLHLSA